MTHRGAVAADAKSADGSGLLLPIPAALFGEGHGVATLYIRGDDPRPAIEAAAAAEGIAIVEWRTPPTDDDQLGDQARTSRPTIVQAILDGGKHPDERAAFRLRRRIAATATGVYVASCSFRTVVYKGLVQAANLGAFYLDLGD